MKLILWGAILVCGFGCGSKDQAARLEKLEREVAVLKAEQEATMVILDAHSNNLLQCASNNAAEIKAMRALKDLVIEATTQPSRP